VPLASVSISTMGSTVVCPSGTAGTATAATSGGNGNFVQWGYRTTPGGMITFFSSPARTGSTYQLTGSDFPAQSFYYLVCVASPSCGSAIISNEIGVSVTSGAPDSTAPSVTPPAASTVTQTLCQ